MGAESWWAPAVPVIDPNSMGLSGLTAKDCGDCHEAIYDEWRRSTHAAAWVDPQFQAELSKDPAVAWLCLNCHTPVSNQQAELVAQSGITRDPPTQRNARFDESLREEGVTCLSCHWRPEGIAAPHKDVTAPHATVYAPELKTDRACTSCHQAVARLDDTLVCHFDTAGEKRRAGIQTSCGDCHMPRIERAVATGGPVRNSGSHLWPGSGIGKGLWEGPHGLDSLQVIAPTVDKVGRLSFTLHNAKAGHMLPTGDPERFLRVTAATVDAQGRTRDEKTWRIGQEWVWHPKAKKLSDNRLQVDERRRYEWRPKQPAEKWLLRIEHVRLSADNLAYHLSLLDDESSRERLKNYPISRVLFDQEIAPSR